MDADDIYLHLSFRPNIVESYTQESFEETFSNAWFNLYPPGMGPDMYLQQEVFERTFFDRFEFLDGRLYLEFQLDVGRFILQVQDSADESCLSDDILGMCFCDYGGLDTHVTVRMALTVPGGWGSVELCFHADVGRGNGDSSASTGAGDCGAIDSNTGAPSMATPLLSRR